MADYGNPPYHESGFKAVLRRLAAGAGPILSGINTPMRPYAGGAEQFFGAAGGAFGATTAAHRAAQEYAQKQIQAEMDQEDRQLRRQALEAQIEQMNKPKPLEDWQLPPEQRAAKIAYARDLANATRPPKEPKEKLVQVTNPDGSTTWLPESQAIGKTAKGVPGETKPPTAGERRSSGALDRAEHQDKTATELEASFKPVDIAALKLPYAVQKLPQRRYTNARKAFTEAVLREFSGAVISKDEYNKYDDIFFAQLGDDATTIAQKQADRAGIMAQLRSMSGNAARQEGLAGLNARLEALHGNSAPAFDPKAAREKYGYGP